MTKNLLDIMGDDLEAGNAAAKGAVEVGRKPIAEDKGGGANGGGASSNVMSMVTQQREIMQGRAAEASLGGASAQSPAPFLTSQGLTQVKKSPRDSSATLTRACVCQEVR